MEDDVGQAAFEAAHRFQGLLAFGALAEVVRLSLAGVADLDQGRDVQGVFEPSVPAAVEAVPVVVRVPCTWASGTYPCRVAIVIDGMDRRPTPVLISAATRPRAPLTKVIGRSFGPSQSRVSAGSPSMVSPVKWEGLIVCLTLPRKAARRPVRSPLFG